MKLLFKYFQLSLLMLTVLWEFRGRYPYYLYYYINVIFDFDFFIFLNWPFKYFEPL